MAREMKAEKVGGHGVLIKDFDPKLPTKRVTVTMKARCLMRGCGVVNVLNHVATVNKGSTVHWDLQAKCGECGRRIVLIGVKKPW